MAFPNDWYWVVNGSTTQVYSTATSGYVQVTDPAYVAWRETPGNHTTPIASEAELGEVLAQYSLRPVVPNLLDGYKDKQARDINLATIAKVVFALTNEIRVLKGQPEINAAQFRNYVKGLM